MSLQDILSVVPAGSPEEALARQVNFDRLPQHIAVIMDGNGRWAAQRHLPRVEGHRAGIDSVRDIVESSDKRTDVRRADFRGNQRLRGRKNQRDVHPDPV